MEKRSGTEIENTVEKGWGKEREYKVLQKKLSELDSRLSELFFHQPDENYSALPPEQHRQRACDDVAVRIGFLKTLLAAEIESHAHQNTPHNLTHIAKRLASLEDDFNNWVDLGILPDDDLGILPDDGVGDPLPCSCTYSCFDAEEEVGGDESSIPEPAVFVPQENEVEEEEGGDERSIPEPAVFVPKGNEVAEGSESQGGGEDKRGARKLQRFSGRQCGFMGMAMAVVAAAAVVLATNFRGEEEVFLVPT